MASIHITDLESAINHWRAQRPSTEGAALAPEVQALASIYAVMALKKQLTLDETDLDPAAWQAWLGWYHTTPDTPCIAICSTSQGDAVCKGCGRSFEEVQRWTEMLPVQKRAVWQRIRQEGTALRFTRYPERAAENRTAGRPDEKKPAP